MRYLRGQDLNFNIVIITIEVIVYLIYCLSGTYIYAFNQYLKQIAQYNITTSDYKYKFPGRSVLSPRIHLIPTAAEELNELSLRFNAQNSKYIMTQDETLAQINLSFVVV